MSYAIKTKEQLTIERLRDIMRAEKNREITEPKDSFAIAWRKGRQDLAEYVETVIDIWTK